MGALQVDLVFICPGQKAIMAQAETKVCSKAMPLRTTPRSPDIDNLRKLVMDALTDVFWTDDSLVCRGTTTKVYSEKPRTEIYIKIL